MLIGIGAPKERTLLLLFLLNDGAVVPIDRIVEALWGDVASFVGERSSSSSTSRTCGTSSDARRSKLCPRAIGCRSLLARSTPCASSGCCGKVGRRRCAAIARLAVALLTRGLALWRGPALGRCRLRRLRRRRSGPARRAASRLLRRAARSPARSRRTRGRACRGGQAQRRAPTARAVARALDDRALPRRPPGRSARGFP